MFAPTTHLRRWLAPALLTFGTAVTSGTAALAQEKPPGYPEKPIRIIISVNPGAGADMVARMTAQILSDDWKENVVVEPRPGGGGVIATEYAARATPDGYTLYQNGFGLLMQGAAKRVKFDILKTFDPIVRLTSQPYILLVNSNVAAKSIKELIAQSASKPLTYSGSSGIGSTVHIGMTQFQKISGMKLKYIAYKGSSPSILALMGGEINMAATSAMSAIAAINTGKVRAVATLGLSRLPVLPDLPSVAEQGYPGFSITNSYVLWAPAGTPKPIVMALNRAISHGMNAPAAKKRLADSGSEPAAPQAPDALRADLVKEYADIEKTVKEIGLKF
jgi:tripartite-type tricarboxylate transporter receptor subunit TctC